MADTLKRDTVPTPTTNGAEHTNGNGNGNGNGSEPTQNTTVVAASASAASRYAETGDIQMLPPRRRRLRVVLPVVLLAALAVGVLWYFVLRPTRSVSIATVQRGTIISTVETTGKLQAETSAKLAFKMSGLVGKVLAKQGDVVKAGQVLAEL